MKFNKSNFPIKATPQEYEKWGKGFFKELREVKSRAENESDYRWKKFNAGLIWSIKEILE